LLQWRRWMFMLVIPFTYYALNGIWRLSKKLSFQNSKSYWKSWGQKVKGLFLLTISLGCVYLATPVLMNSVNAGVFSIPIVNRFFSFSPTVPYQDVNDVIYAMRWLDRNMNSSSCLVSHLAFLGWSQLYLNYSHTIVHFENDVDVALNSALEHGFSQVYFVWWNDSNGWYGISVSECFAKVENFGRIAVYDYSV
jgi:hypothetical protein